MTARATTTTTHPAFQATTITNENDESEDEIVDDNDDVDCDENPPRTIMLMTWKSKRGVDENGEDATTNVDAGDAVATMIVRRRRGWRRKRRDRA